MTDERKIFQANQELSQRIYALHNIFRISLELTSILDREKLIFAYLINLIGLLRAAGAILLLPSNRNENELTPVRWRGFSRKTAQALYAPCRTLRRIVQRSSRRCWQADRQEVGELYQNKRTILAEAGVKLVAPLVHMDTIQGLILIGQKVTGEPYTVADFEMLTLLNNFFATVLKNASLVEALEKLSATDALTQLLNRREFDRQLAKEIDRARRYGQQFSLALLDIDHFKNYNDANGHVEGDKLLREFSRLLVQQLRKTDILARFGGEEFIAILLGADASAAFALCSRLRETIAAHAFPFAERQPLGCVSASIGIAAFPQDGVDAEVLIRKADAALYHAKAAGRNAVFASCMLGHAHGVIPPEPASPN